MIINADDFGLNAEVNRAIVECFRAGYCSDTTIMPNTPGFEDACRLARENGFAGRVGVHFVLTDGAPLTDPIAACPRFCRNGSFVLDRTRRVLRLTRAEREALAAELKAQVARCRRHGLPVTHADSHEHIHEEWAVAAVAMRVCLQERIPYLRLARNCGASRSLLKRAYRHLLNLRIARAGLARTRHFGTPGDYERLVRRRGDSEQTRSVEIVVHPAYNTSGELIDAISRAPLAAHLRGLRAEHRS